MTLPADVEKFVAEEVAAGRYPTAEAVLDAAVVALREKLALDRKRAEVIRELDIGLKQLDAGLGEPLDIDAILNEVLERKNASLAEAG
jgi:Arc/MetJ-type ribon-helix-helix transcriptional regulator